VAERAIVASILNVDLDPFRHRVLLDKGAADGVFKGQAVLDADGIFGQVWRVNEHSSEVIMITDAEHAIPVQSNRSGVRTIAVGTGDLNRLSLPFVTVESDLKKDDLLLSTGMGGVFPPGYPVAQVTKVERTAKATFAIVEARPTAALDRNREVLLVWFKAPAPEPAPVTTSATAGPANGATKSAPATGAATAATTARAAQSPAAAQRTTAAPTTLAAPSPAGSQPTATSPAASEPSASQPAASAPAATTPAATPPGEGATR
jgi:rod shape-determining protein MreC